MKRTLVIAVVAILVLVIAVAASAKPDKPDLDRQPGAYAVTYEHIDALNNCDVDRLMAQYPEDVVIILPDGIFVEGREDVLDLFEGFCSEPDLDGVGGNDGGLAGLQFEEQESWKIDKTINMVWTASADFLCVDYEGADAYETHAGLMVAQVTTFDGSKLMFNGDPDCPSE